MLKRGLLVLTLISCQSSNHDLEVNGENCHQVNTLAWVQAGSFPRTISPQMSSCVTLKTDGGKRSNGSPRGQISTAGGGFSYGISNKNKLDFDILIGGPAVFEVAARAVAQARHEVLMQFHYWDQESKNAKLIIKGLRDLHRLRSACSNCTSPVKVHILAHKDTQVDTALRVTRTLAQRRWNQRIVDIEVVSHNFDRSTFISPIIVDESVAIVTSAQPSLGFDHPKRLYTEGLLVGGDSVKGIRQTFLTELEIYQSAANSETALDSSIEGNPNLHKLFRNPFPQSGNLPVVFTSHLDKEDDTNRNRLALKALISGAKEKIRLLMTELTDKVFIQSLADAGKRGVKLEILLNQAGLCQALAAGIATSLDGLATLLKLSQRNLEDSRWDLRWVGELSKGKPEVVSGNVDFSRGIWPSGYNTINSGSVDSEMVFITGAMSLEANSQSFFVWDRRLANAWFQRGYGIKFERGLPIRSLDPKVYCGT